MATTADAAWPYSSIVVTGANGWLGTRFIHFLRAPFAPDITPFSGRIICLAQPQDRTDELRQLGCAIVSGDIRDPSARDALLQDSAGALLIHLAGVIHPGTRTRAFNEVNYQATLALIEAANAAGVRRAVVMSSNSPCGANPHPEHRFDEASPYQPYMGYGRSKWLMECALRQRIEKNLGPEIVIVRAPWFYGPGQPARQTTFFSMIRNGRFPIVGSGQQRRSMAYVDSLASALSLCSIRPQAANQIYWIADAEPYPFATIVETIRKVMYEDFAMTVAPRVPRVPGIVADVARLVDRTLQGCGLYNQQIHVLSEMNLTIACKLDKAKRELGYVPLVELREGMRRSIDWCLKQGMKL